MAAKITSRDFKRTRSGGMTLNLTRFREFGFGLAVGLSLSLIVLVWQNYRDKNVAKVTAEVPRPEPRSDKDAAAGDVEDSAKNYDFYDMLPNFEVVVPEKDREVSRERDNAPAKIERPGVYVLQAGSYRQQAEADRFATNVLPVIRSILSHGPVGMVSIAAQLNERGIRTARGGNWHVSSVANVLSRAKG